MTTAERHEQSPNGTQAVDRAARLLSEVVHAADPVTFTELTAVTGLAKSTTSRLLLALERNHLVRRDDHGRFLPGEMFVSFAWRGGADTSLVAVAQPFLDRLGKGTGETVNLGVAAGNTVEQIAQVDCAYMIGSTNWVGRPVPLHASGLGKVLLAYGAAKLPPGRSSGAQTGRSPRVRAARGPRRRPRPRVRGHRRGARARAHRVRGARVPLRRHGGGGDVGLRAHHADEPGDSGERGPPLRGRGGRPVVRARPPATDLEEGMRARMTSDELLGELYDKTLTGNAPTCST